MKYSYGRGLHVEARRWAASSEQRSCLAQGVPDKRGAVRVRAMVGGFVCLGPVFVLVCSEYMGVT